MQSISLNNQASEFYSNIANMGLYIYIAYLVHTLFIFQAVNQDPFVWWEDKREELSSVCSSVLELLYGDQCAACLLGSQRWFADKRAIQDQVIEETYAVCIWSQKYGIVS